MKSIRGLVDEVALQCPKHQTLDEIIFTLNKAIITFSKFSIDQNYVITRLVFRWIADNIQYDWVAYLANDFTNADNIDYIFKNKLGVCASYATLFRYICLKLGMDDNNIQCIAGYTKKSL